jgi:pimeloyl-ACP methyl ester carboxylesterase
LRAEGLAASLRGCGQGAFPSLWKKLPELRLPTLLVAGVQDQVYAAMAEKIRARCPRAEVLLVPAAGHMAHLENLPAFAAGLRNFLRGLEPGPGVGLQA